MANKVAAVALAVALLSAQAQSPVFRAKVDLVQVDVVVVDKDGRPVRGLTAHDFALLDRKQPQTISSFDEISHERGRAGDAAFPAGVRRDVSDNLTAQSDRLVILVVDDLHIWRGRTDRAKEIAAGILKDLGPQSSMAVLFTSGDASTQVTADRALLDAAVATLKGRQSVRRPNEAVDNQRSATSSLQAFFENMAQYKTLEDAARMLGAGDARRKAFVLISEGIAKNLNGVFDGEVTPCEAICSSCACYHDTALRAMMESLRRSSVTTYTVDPRGHVSSGQLAQEAFPGPPGMGDDPASNGFRWDNAIRQAQNGLRIIAEASGGFAVVDTDDFASGLQRIIEDLDHYYLLGFYPSDPKGKHYRPLDVKVPGHPDWTVRFRRGYLPGGPPAPPKNSSPLVALSAGVLPKTALPLRMTAIPMPDGRIVTALEVSTPRRELQEPDGKLRDRLQYEVMVVDQKKAKVRSLIGLEGGLTLSPIDASRQPDALAYQVGETFDLPPGRYELRVSAISTKLERGGSVYLDLDVPDLKNAPLAAGGLVVTHAAGTRVPVAPPSAPRGGRGRQTRASAPPPALPFPPSMDREFSANDGLRVYFEGTARSLTGLTATIEILSAEGKVLRSISPPVVSGAPIRVQGLVPLAALAPGGYILRGTLADGVHTAMSQTGFVIK